MEFYDINESLKTVQSDIATIRVYVQLAFWFAAGWVFGRCVGWLSFVYFERRTP